MLVLVPQIAEPVQAPHLLPCFPTLAASRPCSGLRVLMRTGHEAPAHRGRPGVEFGAKTIDIEGKIVKIQIWDTVNNTNFAIFFY